MSKEPGLRSRSITVTRNYRLFKSDLENRPIDLPKHRRLKTSMKEYGFLKCFPIVCVRNGDSQLVVKDGQHRLAFAEELGLPVCYVIEDVDFNIATVNSTPTVWRPGDYAMKYASNGVTEYQEGLEFAEKHKMPIGIAFAILSGTTSFNNIIDAFQSGAFKIKDREYADAVAYTYCALCRLSIEVRKRQLLEAVMAACRVEGFDSERLIAGASKCRERLVSYGTRDAYLDLLEDLYNYNRVKLVPLKISAIQVMRERRPAVPKERKKEAS